MSGALSRTVATFLWTSPSSGVGSAAGEETREGGRERGGGREGKVLNASSIAVNSIQVDTQNKHMVTLSLTKRTQCFAATYTHKRKSERRKERGRVGHWEKREGEKERERESRTWGKSTHMLVYVQRKGGERE